MKPKIFVFKSKYEQYMIPLPTTRTSTDSKGGLNVETLHNNGQIVFNKYEYRTTDENIANYIRNSKWFKKRDIIEIESASAAQTKEPVKSAATITPIHGQTSRNDVIAVLVGPPYSVQVDDIKDKSLSELRDFSRRTFSIDFVDAVDESGQGSSAPDFSKASEKNRKGKASEKGKKPTADAEHQQ